MEGYTKVRFVHIMLNMFQHLRHQLSDILLPPENDLCPWLQVQETEVGLR